MKASMCPVTKEKWLSGGDNLRKYEKCLQSPIFQVFFLQKAVRGRSCGKILQRCFARCFPSESGKGVDFNLYLGVLRLSLAFAPGVSSVFFVILLVGIISLGSTLNPFEDEKEKYREILLVCNAAVRSVGRCLFFGQDGKKFGMCDRGIFHHGISRCQDRPQ